MNRALTSLNAVPLETTLTVPLKGEFAKKLKRVKLIHFSTSSIIMLPDIKDMKLFEVEEISVLI